MSLLIFRLKQRLRALFRRIRINAQTRSLMFGVTPGDPLTFVAVSSLLIAITITASRYRL